MDGRIARLYIHCSGSSWGNALVINLWHKVRRFLTSWNGNHISIGYNYVIGNKFPFDAKHGYDFLNGRIETARPDWISTAAVKGDNRDTVHICLIGNAGEFSQAQIKTAMVICRHYIGKGLAVENVRGHYEYWTFRGEQPLKSCPGMNMSKFRNDLRGFLEKGRVAKPIPIKVKTRSDAITKALGAWNLMLGGGRA